MYIAIKTKLYRLQLAVILAIGISGVTASWGAESRQVRTGVTITVPKVLGLGGSVSQVTLAFPDAKKGSQTRTETVTYSVRANSVNRQNGLIQAQMEGSVDNMNVMVSVGNFSNEGGDAHLVPSSSGYLSIPSDAINLCDRKIDLGGGGGIEGSIPISYKAVATTGLTPRNYSKSILLSITDN